MKSIAIEKLREDHVKDFIQWGIHGDPLFSMYNFEEDLEGVSEWYQWKVSGKNDHYFAIVKGGFALGYMGLKRVNKVMGSAHLGIIIDANFMGQGIGTQAISWLLDYGFCQLELKKIDLEVLPWNVRALGLYEKLGFLVKSKRWRHLDLDPFLIKGEKLDPFRDRILKWSSDYYVQVDVMTISKDKWRCQVEI